MAKYEKVMNMNVSDMVECFYNHSKQLINVMDTLKFMYQTFKNDNYRLAYNRCNVALNTILAYKD